jgi:acetyltransferase-like isoleucine patch superfamily enzyme
MTQYLWKLGQRCRDGVLTRWWQVIGRLGLKSHGARFGPGLRLYGLPVISMSLNSSIVLGCNVVLCSHSRFTALGVAHPVILRTIRESARIVVGNSVGLSGTVICAALSVEIGDECLVGANVQIFDTDFHALKPENRRFNNEIDQIASSPVLIGRNVFIGAGTIICKGVTIGDNAVIGAGSVVTRDIAAGLIAAGNPVVVIGAIGQIS